MTLEEKKNLLIKMGLCEETAKYYLKEDSNIRAVLPAFRLLKPLNDCLEYYNGEYRKMIEKTMEDGTLEERLPEVAALVKCGASPDIVEKFAFHLVLEAYDGLLYQLDDHESAEFSDVFMDEDFSKCGYAQLMEMDADGNATGRYLTEVHGKIPFSIHIKFPVCRAF